MTRTLDTLAFLIRWKRDQQVDYTLSYSDCGIGVLASPCACASIAVPIDFPLDADFAATLESRLDHEWRLATANCICHQSPYTMDLTGVGRDEPETMNLECNCCDRKGPSLASVAKADGWVAVGPVDREERDWQWYTHLGFCPHCATSLAPEDRADLGIDAT